MARIARNRAHLGLPIDAPLTPGTFNQEIAIPQLQVLLSDCSVLRLDSKMPFGQLVFLPQHVAPSFQGLQETKPLQKRALIYEIYRLYQ